MVLAIDCGGLRQSRGISNYIENLININEDNNSPNTIYIKNFEKVNNLVKDAKKIKIHNSVCRDL